MKFKLWIYQDCCFNEGQLTVSTCEFDARILNTLRCTLHSVQEVELDVEPLELDYTKELLELRKRAEEFKKQALRDELAKLEVA